MTGVDNDASTRRESSRVAWLDQVRGVAIFMVVAVHCAQGLNSLNPYFLRVLEFGQFGVQLFFVASAYTLAMTYVERAGEQHRVRKFYVRRFFRIAPLYYCAILFYALFHFSMQLFWARVDRVTVFPYDLLGVLANASFSHMLFATYHNNVVPGGWSIGVEMLFYVIFPVAFYAAQVAYKFAALRGVFFISAITICLAIAASVMLAPIGGLANGSFEYFGLLNQAPVFVVGICLYFYLENNCQHPSKAVLFSLLFLSAMSSALLWSIEPVNAYSFLPLTVALSFGFAIILFRSGSGRHREALAAIGRQSFSIYLCHWVFAFAVGVAQRKLFPGLKPEIMFFLGFPAVLFVSWLLSRHLLAVVESKGINIGKRLNARLG